MGSWQLIYHITSKNFPFYFFVTFWGKIYTMKYRNLKFTIMSFNKCTYTWIIQIPTPSLRTLSLAQKIYPCPFPCIWFFIPHYVVEIHVSVVQFRCWAVFHGMNISVCLTVHLLMDTWAISSLGVIMNKNRINLLIQVIW